MQRITLHDLEDRQLFCRRGALGHAWEEVTKPAKEGQWGYRIHDLCVRCGMERTTIFNIHGDEATRYYQRPNWHLKLTEPVTTADVRVEYTRRRRKSAKVPTATRGGRTRLRAV